MKARYTKGSPEEVLRISGAPTAEPGSRASRSRAASAGPGHSSHGSHGHNSHRRRKNSQKKKIIIGVLVGILALVAVILGAAYAYLDHHMDIANKSDFDKSDVTNLELSQETRDKMGRGFWTIAIFGVGFQGQFHR